MTHKPIFIAACIVAFSGAALANDAHDHSGQKAPSAAAPDEPAGNAMAGMGRMHEHMKRMQEQMGKIRAATDLKEKERLMEEHMKTMQESMSMMQGMMHGARPK